MNLSVSCHVWLGLGSLQCLWPQRIFFDAMKLMKRLGFLLHTGNELVIRIIILMMQILFRKEKASSRSSAMSKRPTFPLAPRQRLTFSVVSASTPEIIHPESWWPSSKVVTSINGFAMEQQWKTTRYYNSIQQSSIIPFLGLMRDGGWSSDCLFKSLATMTCWLNWEINYGSKRFRSNGIYQSDQENDGKSSWLLHPTWAPPPMRSSKIWPWPTRCRRIRRMPVRGSGVQWLDLRGSVWVCCLRS